MKPINPNQRIDRTFRKYNKNSWFWSIKKSFFWNKKTVIKLWVAVFFIFIVVIFWWVQRNVYSNLPDVSTIKDMVFAQATVITDRNGNELYKVFDQNRQYVPYEEISETMIQAIVAMEDQRYWDHKWLDPVGIIRAWMRTALGSTQWASTIPQQLVMNLLLYRGRSFTEKVTRKLKEMVLTVRLDKVLESQIRAENRWLHQDQLRRKMKETTLELYLNYIFLGNNAYGIEAASQTYFGIPAKNLGVLESAIIASIPKWPSIYEPYRNRRRLMWEIRFSDMQDNTIEIYSGLQQEAYDAIARAINTMKVNNKSSSNDVLKSIQNAWNIRLSYEWRSFQAQYIIGRKDLALTRMYEDGYIDESTLKSALIQWLDYQFKSHVFAINAPHFVHWITDLLEQEYDKSLIQQWWLIVKTTLDLDIQQQAEKIFRDTQWDLAGHGANNKAMLYIDSSNGDVLAYVWSTDYFNEIIEWKNDVIRRRRQIWSSIKPLIYALGFQQLPINLDTPIFDIPFAPGGDEPSNADGEFLGLMPLRQALAFSRNIPAIKMFFALGGEAVAKPRLQQLWLNSLANNIEYGYPLSLWAGEITMLELADAYIQLSRQGERVTINPILEIRSNDGSLLYEKEVERSPSVISAGAASLIWEILSNTANMPSNWVGMFSVRWLRLAAKSWTSDVKTATGNRPRDWWLATYTPSRVALFWVGNTDGAAMNRNAFWWTVLWSNMRSFYSWLLSNNHIVNESMTMIDTIDMQVSELTGLPIWESTPSQFIKNTLGIVGSQGNNFDPWAKAIEIDTACNGLSSPFTPLEDIKNGYLIQAYSFMPNDMDLSDIRLWWTRASASDTWWVNDLSWTARQRALATRYNFNNIFITAPTEPCPDRIPKEDQRIQVEIVLPQAAWTIARNSSITYNINSPKMIREVTIFVNDEIVGRNRYNPARTSIVDSATIQIPTSIVAGNIVIKVVAADIVGFSNTASQTITLANQDANPPRIENRRVISNSDGSYEVRLFIVDDESYVISGSVKKWGTQVHTITNSVVSFTTNTLWDFTVTAIDYYGNTLEQTITLQP
jgi:penicillin-binding protein 1A